MPPVEPDPSLSSDESEHSEHLPDHHISSPGPLYEPPKDSSAPADKPAETNVRDEPDVSGISSPIPPIVAPEHTEDDPAAQLSAHQPLNLSSPSEKSPDVPGSLSTKPVPPPPDTIAEAPVSTPAAPQVFGPSFHASVAATPQPSSTPVMSEPTTSAAPVQPVTTSEAFTALQPTSAKKRSWLKKAIIPIVVVLLVGGSAAAYFGYYMSPGVIWSQSLSNSAQGYNKLISYLTAPSTTHYKGLIETGKFNLKLGSTNASGTLSSQSEGANSTVSLKVDLGVTNLDLEERSITASGNSEPDVYLQLSGIKELDNNYLGGGLGSSIDGLDGQWIEIDHNLIADLEDSVVKQQSTSGTSQPLTWADVESFLKSAGVVNQKYLFTTNKATAVTKVVKDYGMVTLNGQKTYHYLVGFNAANTKAYITAICNALQGSNLGAYLKQELGINVASSSVCVSLETNAEQIKSSDTLNVWADVNTRLIYQIRDSSTSNPAQNFIDFGLNYKGGNSYPFFISGESNSGSGTTTLGATATLNTKTNSVSLSLNVTSPSDAGTTGSNLSGSLTFQPTNQTLNVSAPSGAVPITTILDEFGLGPYLSELESNGSGVSISPQDILGTGTSLIEGL